MTDPISTASARSRLSTRPIRAQSVSAWVGRWPLALVLWASTGGVQAAEFDGRQLSAWWGLPFAGILLCIALMPLLTPQFWHHHFGKVAAGWALAFLLPFAWVFGPDPAASGVAHALLAEYIPFIILLTALFTTAGGIFIRGNLHGSTGTNVTILVAGAVLASFMGTTGASMLLIRPLLSGPTTTASTKPTWWCSLSSSSPTPAVL